MFITRLHTRHRLLSVIAACALAQGLAGCAQPGGGGEREPWVPAGVRADAADEPVTLMMDARPAALVSGKAISWMELRPILAEVAGGQAIEEVILDRQISAALAERGLVVTAEDAARERTLLLESLSDEPAAALRLLEELKNRQGLGPARFDAMLKRNASLRMLVRPEVSIGEQDVALIYDLRHGEKRQGRVMILPNLSEATKAMHRVRGGENFSDVAAEVSIDTSAARGGLLEPISRGDPSYPQALRGVLFNAQEGETSAPILLSDQYALVQLVRITPPDGTALDEVRDEMERLARLRQERMRMDQLARAMMRDVRVTIFDNSLADSWRRHRTGGGS